MGSLACASSTCKVLLLAPSQLACPAFLPSPEHHPAVPAPPCPLPPPPSITLPHPPRPASPCSPAQYNPRFEEDFVSGKDYDPDRWALLLACGCLSGYLPVRSGLPVWLLVWLCSDLPPQSLMHSYLSVDGRGVARHQPPALHSLHTERPPPGTHALQGAVGAAQAAARHPAGGAGRGARAASRCRCVGAAGVQRRHCCCSHAWQVPAQGSNGHVPSLLWPHPSHCSPPNLSLSLYLQPSCRRHGTARRRPSRRSSLPRVRLAAAAASHAAVGDSMARAATPC